MSATAAIQTFGVGDRLPTFDGNGEILTVTAILRLNFGTALATAQRDQDKVRAARATYERAIDAIGRKPGRDSLRAWLVGIREGAKRRIDLVEAVGDLDGPAVAKLIEHAETTSAALNEAKVAFHYATPETVRAARDALDVATAADRHAWIAVNTILGELSNPLESPDLKAFEAAEQDARRVIELAKHRPARALQEALRLGARLDTFGEMSGAAKARVRLEMKIIEAFTTEHEAFTWMRKRAAEAE